MKTPFPDDNEHSKTPTKVKLTEAEYTIELKKTYQTIHIFSLVGVGLVVLMVSLLIYDFSQFLELSQYMIPLGGAIFWMSRIMKKNTNTQGISKYRDRLVLNEKDHLKTSSDSTSYTSDNIKLKSNKHHSKEPLEIALPKSIEVKRFDNYLQINRKWFSYEGFFFIGFGLLFFIALIFTMKDSVEWLLLFGIFQLGLIYYGIAKLINTTQIYVSNEVLEVKHSPLPWLGRQRINVNDIKQVYSKRFIASRTNTANRSVYYEVHLINHNEEEKSLLTGLDNSLQAQFIEEQIEKYLNISDLLVRGEITQSDIQPTNLIEALGTNENQFDLSESEKKAVETLQQNINQATSKIKSLVHKIAIGLFIIAALSVSYNILTFMGSDFAVATVEAVKEIKTSDSYSYKPSFIFVDKNGSEHTVTTFESASWYNYPVGSKVEINYDIDDLSTVHVNNVLSLFFFPGFVFLLGIFLFFFSMMKKSDKSSVLLNAIERLQKYQSTDFLKISYQWRSNTGWVLLGMAAFWVMMIYIQTKGSFVQIDLIRNLILIGFFLIPAFMAYIGLAKLINKTTVLLTTDKLIIKHQPLPWLGNLQVPVSDIKQVFVRKELKNSVSGKTTYYSYQLHVVTHQDRLIELLSNFKNIEEAKYVEQEIESFLGIEDQSVRSESR